MFLKFGSLEHITDMYENGTIYINTIEYFRKHEDGNLRGDSYEGATKITNFTPGKLRISGIEREFDYLNFHLKETYENILGNIYCLIVYPRMGFRILLSLKLTNVILNLALTA